MGLLTGVPGADVVFQHMQVMPPMCNRCFFALCSHHFLFTHRLFWGIHEGHNDQRAKLVEMMKACLSDKKVRPPTCEWMTEYTHSEKLVHGNSEPVRVSHCIGLHRGRSRPPQPFAVLHPHVACFTRTVFHQNSVRLILHDSTSLDLQAEHACMRQDSHL